MMANLFALCLFVSLGVLVYMINKDYNNIDMDYWSMAIVIPISLLGYTLKATAVSVDDAEMAFCFLYLDSTILLVLMLFSMIKSLGLKPKRGIRTAAYAIVFLHLITIWACKNNDLYYATFEIIRTPMGTVTKMTDGPLKITHYVFLALVFIAIISVLVWCGLKKKDASKKAMLTYGLFSASGIILYAVEMTAGVDFSLLPFLYVIGDVAIAISYEKFHSHDIGCVIVDHKKEDSKRGYVAFDLYKHLLCYNDNAVSFVPELKGKRIDAWFDESDSRLIEVFYPIIDEYKRSKKASADFTIGDVIFRCSVTYFYMHEGGKPTGFLVEIQDITTEKGYMNIIREYGHSLEKDVSEKTEHIKFIQQRIVLGMATIIENRDMNTGGHVRRTSDIIKILVDEIRKQKTADIDDVYADEIIRSAPMHDLGKISIESSILNKPAKLTDEEYRIMKTHSAKSGEIVEAILSGVEDPHFVQTAYRLARFHHERWDGKGYPERLMETEIPLEARIMAVADVYDALVSKRCYKEPMSFDKAAQIMLEGMGSQFDPMMKSVFESCREQLEEYYTIQNAEA